MEPALLAKLLAAAIRLTGLPAIEIADLPPMIPMSKAALAQEICPQRAAACDTLIALFEPKNYRIIYRDHLDLKKAYDQSTLVHEIVHVLQFKVMGVSIFANCESIMGSERQAFQVQDRYLGENGEERRVAGAFRFMRCDDSKPPKDVQ